MLGEALQAFGHVEPFRVDWFAEGAPDHRSASLASEGAGERVQRALAAVRERELVRAPPARPRAGRGGPRHLGRGGGATELVERGDEVRQGVRRVVGAGNGRPPSCVVGS